MASFVHHFVKKLHKRILGGLLRTQEIFMKDFKELVSVTPIDKVTVAQLVKKTGLSRQAFYNHFKDKHDLSIQIYERSFAPIAQGHRDRETTWLESGVQHLEIYAADKEYYRNVLSSYDRSSLRFYLKDRMYREFRHKCELRGAVFDTPDKIYALKMVVFATNEMTFEWVEGGCQEPADVIVKRFDLCRPMLLAPYLEDDDSALPTNPIGGERSALAHGPSLNGRLSALDASTLVKTAPMAQTPPRNNAHGGQLASRPPQREGYDKEERARGLVFYPQRSLRGHTTRQHSATHAHAAGAHALHETAEEIA